MAKDHAELQQSINQAIRILKANGVIDSIVNRHLERGIAVAYTPKTSDVKKVGPEALLKLGLKKSLRFATNATFEPFEYYQDGKIVGIDVDVANAIGDVMGVDVEILDMEFDAIITSVQAGKADAGIAGITVTPGAGEEHRIHRFLRRCATGHHGKFRKCRSSWCTAWISG